MDAFTYEPETGLLVTPPSWFGRDHYLHHGDVFHLARRRDNGTWVVPMNLPNLEIGFAGAFPDPHPAGLEERAAELIRRKACFARAEQVKLDRGVVKHDIGGIAWEEPFGLEHSAHGVELYFQQRAGAWLIGEVRKGMLAMQQRTGKSFTALAGAEDKFHDGEIDALFVVSNTRLLATAWAFDREKVMPHRMARIMASDADRAFVVEHDVQVFLSSFESCALNWAVVRRIVDPRRILVICDETIKIKTPLAKRTQGTQWAIREAGYAWLLSGAPISKRQSDIWSQLYAIDPGLVGDSVQAFEDCFLQEDQFGNLSFKNGKKKLLDEIMSCAVFRCTRGESEQFTGRSDVSKTVRLKMDPLQAEVYRQMVQTYMATLEDGRVAEGEALSTETSNMLVQLLRLREICGGFFSFEWAERCYSRVRFPINPKIEWLRQHYDEHEGVPSIIFCEFNEEEAMIGDLLDELDIAWGGDEKIRRGDRRRGESVRDAQARHVAEFQEGHRQVFLGKHSSIGHGITLSAADEAIFYGIGFNSDNYDQARQRGVRGGKCTLIYHLILSGTVEAEKVFPTLRKRGNMRDELLDDAKRKGYYSMFAEIDADIAKVIAAEATHDDPIERTARKATGYDGVADLGSFDRWLYDGNSHPILEKIETLRGIGSIRNAYRNVLRYFHPDRCDVTGVDYGVATKITIATVERLKATDGGTLWADYIKEIQDALGLALGNRRSGDDEQFDLYCAYLRAKFGAKV